MADESPQIEGLTLNQRISAPQAIQELAAVMGKTEDQIRRLMPDLDGYPYEVRMWQERGPGNRIRIRDNGEADLGRDDAVGYEIRLENGEITDLRHYVRGMVSELMDQTELPFDVTGLSFDELARVYTKLSRMVSRTARIMPGEGIQLLDPKPQHQEHHIYEEITLIGNTGNVRIFLNQTTIHEITGLDRSIIVNKLVSQRFDSREEAMERLMEVLTQAGYRFIE